jgi:hypothetical protein
MQRLAHLASRRACVPLARAQVVQLGARAAGAVTGPRGDGGLRAPCTAGLRARGLASAPGEDELRKVSVEFQDSFAEARMCIADVEESMGSVCP